MVFGHCCLSREVGFSHDGVDIAFSASAMKMVIDRTLEIHSSKEIGLYEVER